MTSTGEGQARHGSERRAGTGRRVLFVDDEPELLEGIRLALRREPYEIATATSALDALALCETHSFEVVVSDERMPGMSGAEFLAIVRAKWPKTIRIVLTGQASVEAAIRAINQGEVYRFLTKPCEPVVLGATIRDAMLLRDIAEQSARLLAAARRQRALLVGLERQHPGITHVERTGQGVIVLEEDEGELDPAQLIAQMKHEADEAELAARRG